MNPDRTTLCEMAGRLKRCLFNFHRFDDEDMEGAFWEQRQATPFTSAAGRRAFNALSVLYCAAVGVLDPFAAAVSLVLWIYCRVGQRTVGCFILSLIVSYLYLVYAFASRDMASFWRELSLLAALNVIVLGTRLSHEAIARTLFQHNAALEKLATQDELTAVYCRRHICELGRKEFNRSRRSGEPFGVMLIDVDHLKVINDRYGHAAGDKALVDLATAMHDSLRSEDHLGRYGGDEFLVVLPNTGPSGAEQTAGRLRCAIHSRPLIHRNVHVSLSVSIGLAILDRETESFHSLVDRADIALYDAKTHGRDQVRAWSDVSGRRSSVNDVSELTA